MAAEQQLQRCGVDAFDLLLLHNPDRTGYTSDGVWAGMAALRDAGLTQAIGVAPGPANGFTLDLIDCFERFGSQIDWAMIILNPLEPWPGELVLDAAAAHDVRTITRVVDYGGLFWDDVLPDHAFAERDHRLFRPEGWVQAGRERMDRMRPIAERHGLTPLQLAAQWNLAHPTVELVAPTLIQEPGPRRPLDRGQARRAGCGATRGGARPRRGRGAPRDRRQHRVHGAQGRHAAARGSRGGRPVGAGRRALGGGVALAHRPGAPARRAHMRRARRWPGPPLQTVSLTTT